MPKAFTAFRYILLPSCISCKRIQVIQGRVHENNTLILFPEFLISLTGAGWSEVQSKIENKPAYDYAEISDTQIKAAITLPGIDTSNGQKVSCSLLLNVGRLDDRVTGVDMHTVDSLSSMPKRTIVRHATLLL